MNKQNSIVAGLTFISLVALVVAYFAPIWWVSLTAPNYPPDAFPDGIRIHFHFRVSVQSGHAGQHVQTEGRRSQEEVRS